MCFSCSWPHDEAFQTSTWRSSHWPMSVLSEVCFPTLFHLLDDQMIITPFYQMKVLKILKKREAWGITEPKKSDRATCQDSKRGPFAYRANALPTELQVMVQSEWSSNLTWSNGIFTVANTPPPSTHTLRVRLFSHLSRGPTTGQPSHAGFSAGWRLTFLSWTKFGRFLPAGKFRWFFVLLAGDLPLCLSKTDPRFAGFSFSWLGICLSASLKWPKGSKCSYFRPLFAEPSDREILESPQSAPFVPHGACFGQRDDYVQVTQNAPRHFWSTQCCMCSRSRSSPRSDDINRGIFRSARAAVGLSITKKGFCRNWEVGFCRVLEGDALVFCR